MKRLVASACSVLILFAACGGKTQGQTPGYLDDAGAYHDLDGKVLFSRSGGCAGYDPQTFFLPAPSCANKSDCESWARKHLPATMPVAWSCGNYGDGPCIGAIGYFADGNPGCNPGPDGDAFCDAFYNQFLLGAGTITASCGRSCVGGWDNTDGVGGCRGWSSWGTCAPSSVCLGLTDPKTGDYLCKTNDLFCVQRDGQPLRCEPPCQPFP